MAILYELPRHQEQLPRLYNNSCPDCDISCPACSRNCAALAKAANSCPQLPSFNNSWPQLPSFSNSWPQLSNFNNSWPSGNISCPVCGCCCYITLSKTVQLLQKQIVRTSKNLHRYTHISVRYKKFLNFENVAFNNLTSCTGECLLPFSERVPLLPIRSGSSDCQYFF